MTLVYEGIFTGCLFLAPHVGLPAAQVLFKPAKAWLCAAPGAAHKARTMKGGNHTSSNIDFKRHKIYLLCEVAELPYERDVSRKTFSHLTFLFRELQSVPCGPEFQQFLLMQNVMATLFGFCQAAHTAITHLLRMAASNTQGMLVAPKTKVPSLLFPTPEKKEKCPMSPFLERADPTLQWPMA